MAIIAKTTVIAGGKKYKAGQTIPGLSDMDKEWMKEAGYITETSSRKEEKKVAAEESNDEL